MREFSLEYINYRTKIQNERMDEIKKIISDPELRPRLNEQLCVFCYYPNTVAGQGFTKRNCLKCKTEMTFSTTSTDCLCEKCAFEHVLCKHCGADLYLSKRKVL